MRKLHAVAVEVLANLADAVEVIVRLVRVGVVRAVVDAVAHRVLIPIREGGRPGAPVERDAVGARPASPAAVHDRRGFSRGVDPDHGGADARIVGVAGIRHQQLAVHVERDAFQRVEERRCIALDPKGSSHPVEAEDERVVPRFRVALVRDQDVAVVVDREIDGIDDRRQRRDGERQRVLEAGLWVYADQRRAVRGVRDADFAVEDDEQAITVDREGYRLDQVVLPLARRQLALVSVLVDLDDFACMHLT